MLQRRLDPAPDASSAREEEAGESGKKVETKTDDNTSDPATPLRDEVVEVRLIWQCCERGVYFNSSYY